MEFYERFQKLLLDSECTIANLSRATGIPYTTLDGIIKKKSKSTSLDNAFAIAKYFKVSVEYLGTGKDDKPRPISLTKNEEQLIVLWRQLPHDEQMQEIGRIGLLLEQCAAYDKEKNG